MLRVSAALLGLLAIELGDAGDQRAARLTWGTAIRAADASGHRATRVWARGRAAEDAFFAGRSPQVVSELTDEAVHISGATPCHGLARAHAARVYLATARGRKTEVTKALGNIKGTFERLPEPQTPQSVFSYRETQLAWEETFAYVHMGDPRAAASLQAARTLYPSHALAARSNLDLMEAVAQVKSRDITTGLQQALGTLQGETRQNSGGRLLATSIFNALPTSARALPEARELRTLSTA